MIGGIDLGLKGAVAVIGDGAPVLIDMPTYETVINKKKRNLYDLNKVVDIVKEHLTKCECVFLEKVQPIGIPGTTPSANFWLGYGRGIFEALLLQYKIRHEYVSSKDWQKSFGIVKPTDKELAKKWATKGPALEVARRLFPGAELTTERGRVLDGRSDALLIAEYGKRQLAGGAK